MSHARCNCTCNFVPHWIVPSATFGSEAEGLGCTRKKCNVNSGSESIVLKSSDAFDNIAQVTIIG